MKEKLSDLTLAEFIDMECGDLNVLKEKHEIVTPEMLAKKRSELSHEFQSIASPSSFKSMLIDRDRKGKMRVKAMFFGVLKSLIKIDGFSDVRDLLTKYGVDCRDRDDAWIEREVITQLNSVTFELKRMGVEIKEEGQSTPDEIRRRYEGMVADLMIANKMSIDIDSIRASVFASMIHKANEIAKELNAKIKSLK
jgi:hypothetical protein